MGPAFDKKKAYINVTNIPTYIQLVVKKIGKIVNRKFAIFSSGLIFEEKLFKLYSSFLLCIL